MPVSVDAKQWQITVEDRLTNVTVNRWDLLPRLGVIRMWCTDSSARVWRVDFTFSGDMPRVVSGVGA